MSSCLLALGLLAQALDLFTHTGIAQVFGHRAQGFDRMWVHPGYSHSNADKNRPYLTPGQSLVLDESIGYRLDLRPVLFNQPFRLDS